MDLILEIGLAFGVISFCLLILQVILTSRWKPLERFFALDHLTNYHKLFGMLIGFTLTCHIIIMISKIKFENIAIDLGEWAYAIALINITLAFLFPSFGLDYNIWRISHKSTHFIIVLAFIHSYLIGPQIQIPAVRIFWWFLLLVWLSVFLYRNFYIPVFMRKIYNIESIRQETHNTFTLTYLPQKGNRFDYKPGQFLFLKLKRPGRKSELHPFTISSSPTQGDFLQNTIKQSGNYTNTIDQTLITDKAIIEGPYGKFSFLNTKSKSLLFIAGGVGITPLMSMIRYLRDTKDSRQVILLYANRTIEDIIFKQELEELPANFKIVHIMSNEDEKFQGIKGHITKDVIAQSAKEILNEADVFICGPPAMMQKALSILKELKVPLSRIHYERFSI
jgi:3-phenylpropionate/trans-cinnamate dioxygenase ferredoxin reductase subunit